MNKSTLTFLLAILLGLSSASVRAQSIADTPANRDAQADRYLAAMPPKEYFGSMAKKLSANMPEGPQREQVVKALTTGLDMDALQKAMKASLVKHFTAEELKALADFNGSPVGKSAMSKMPDYTADLMPIIQAQVMKSMMGGGAGAPGGNE